jgi:hypothetical protein
MDTDGGCLNLMLRSTVSRPVSLGIKNPSWPYDQIFIIVWELQVCWFGALSLTRGRVCRVQVLLALASAIIFGSEFRGTHYHISLSQSRNYPIRRLLRLAGLRWRYSNQTPHGILCVECVRYFPWISLSAHRLEHTAWNSSLSWKRHICCAGKVSVDSGCLKNQHPIWFQYSEVGCCVDSYALPKKVLREASRYNIRVYGEHLHKTLTLTV